MEFILVILALLIVVVIVVNLGKKSKETESVNEEVSKVEEVKSTKTEVKNEVKESNEEEVKFQDLLDKIDEGWSMLYKAKRVELVESIDEEKYGIKIPKGQVMRAQLESPIQLARYKKVTERVGYAGPRAKIKIAKGLSYNFGTSRVKVKEQDKLNIVAKGNLYITNKSIIHNGDTKVSKIPLNKIIDLGVEGDYLFIKKDTGAPFVLTTNKALATLLNDLINHLIDEL